MLFCGEVRQVLTSNGSAADKHSCQGKSTYPVEIIENVHDDDGRQQAEVDLASQLLLQPHSLFRTEISDEFGCLQGPVGLVDSIGIFDLVQVLGRLFIHVIAGDVLAGFLVSRHIDKIPREQ